MLTSERVPMPDHRGVHGRAVLELLDPRSGKVVKRAEGENFIGFAMLTHNRWRQRQEYWTGNPGVVDPEPTYPFTQVVLMSSALAETAPDARINGVVRAYATKAAFAGADVYLGSLISASSSASKASAIWTWEWPTHAGLGLINSVGTRATPDTGIETWPLYVGGLDVFPPGNGGAGMCGLCYDPADGTIWYANGSNLVKCSFDLVAGTRADLFTGPSNAQMGLSTRPFGIAVDTTKVYVCEPATGTIKSFTKPTGTGDVTESSITVSGVSAPRVLAFDGSHLWTYQASNNTLYRFDKTTGVIERSFTAPFSGTVYALAWNTDRSQLMVSATGPFIYMLDLNGAIVDKIGHNANAGTLSTESGRGGIAYLGTQTTRMHGSAKEVLVERYDFNASGSLAGVRAASLMALGSRTVLGSEVEKTNLTGMRLTYTFTFS